MGFNFSLFFIQEELSQMSKYLDIVDSALETNLRDVVSSHEEELRQEESLEGYSDDFNAGLTQEELEESSDDYVEWVISKQQDELIEAGQGFPQLLRISFVILWYSFVEQKLLDFCEELHLTISVSPKNEENIGKGIRRARKFLSQSNGYEIYQKHWIELVYIGKLRNLLVHEGKRINLSYLKPDGESIVHKKEGALDLYIPVDKDLYEYMKKHNLFVISGVFFEINPSTDYCKELVKFGGEFFKKLYNDLRSVEN